MRVTKTHSLACARARVGLLVEYNTRPECLCSLRGIGKSRLWVAFVEPGIAGLCPTNKTHRGHHDTHKRLQRNTAFAVRAEVGLLLNTIPDLSIGE